MRLHAKEATVSIVMDGKVIMGPMTVSDVKLVEPCAAEQNGMPRCTIDNAVDGTVCGSCQDNWNPSTVRNRRRRAKMTPNERTRIRAQNAAKRRVELLRQIAKPGPHADTGLCARCGTVHHLSNLEVDHIDGRKWKLSDVAASTRYSRYWREYKAGVRLRALCRGCNAQDGGGRRDGRRGRRK